MTRIRFRALIELKSDIVVVVVDKLLMTTATGQLIKKHT